MEKFDASCMNDRAGIRAGSNDGGGLVEAGLDKVSMSSGKSQVPSILIEGGSSIEICCDGRYVCVYRGSDGAR